MAEPNKPDDNIFTYNLEVDSSPTISYYSYIIDDIKKALIAGSVCAVVSAMLNPMDVTKIRLQNQVGDTHKYSGFIPGMRMIIREEGLYGLSKGIEASMMREISYSSVRIGAYEPLRGFFASCLGHDPKDTTPIVKFSSALMSGAMGACMANPLDLIKTRYQACMPGEALPYPHTIAAIKTIYRKHGLMEGLYKGWQVTTIRAAILTSAQIGSYDSIKNNLLVKTFGVEEGFFLHLTSSMMAGIITTTATNPADVIKTRYMSDKVGKYKSPLHCILLTFQEDGPRGFFKGWLPAYWRLGPHTVISLLLIERVRALVGLSSL